MTTLLDPVSLGELTLANRIVMSPLTRCRAGDERVPNALMAEYYGQRADAGLIISEATSVNAMGVGYPQTPGIWSDEQVEGWKLVTDAVHAKGGKIVLQLWHVGRVSDPIFLEGKQSLAPSPIAVEGHVRLVRPERPYETPRAMTVEEIEATIEDYRKGAENAKKAGFDGVEVHGANGYLPDQFLQTCTNQRDDEWGGSLENRARFLLAVTDAVIDVWGAGKVGVHLSPRCDTNGMSADEPEAVFGYVAEELGKRKIAFIFTREHFNAPALTPMMKAKFGGAVIANEAMDRATGERLIHEGAADAIAFGKAYIANPDLVTRLAENAPLNPLDVETMYSHAADGYTDYPPLDK